MSNYISSMAEFTPDYEWLEGLNASLGIIDYEYNPDEDRNDLGPYEPDIDAHYAAQSYVDLKPDEYTSIYGEPNYQPDLSTHQHSTYLDNVPGFLSHKVYDPTISYYADLSQLRLFWDRYTGNLRCDKIEFTYDREHCNDCLPIVELIENVASYEPPKSYTDCISCFNKVSAVCTQCHAVMATYDNDREAMQAFTRKVLTHNNSH